jgi:tetratricopeptide (TPR) repeat protein
MFRSLGLSLFGALSLAGVHFAPSTSFAQTQEDEVALYVTAAARLYENLEYERALEQLERAKKRSRGIRTDVEIALYQGLIRADMGQREESVAAFKAALLLRPDVRLPVRTSPKTEAGFEAVRAQVKKELAAVAAKKALEPNENWGAEGPDLKGTLAAPSPPRSAAVPIVLLAVAAAAGGVGAYFGVQASEQVSAARLAENQLERQRLLQRAATPALTANILFGGAGAAGLSALLTYLFYTRAPASSAAPVQP